MEHHGAEGPAWALALQQSALGELLRSSTWLYPAVECLHILGFALLVGAIACFDLRALRSGSGTEAGELRTARAGFALAVPMGLLLFTTEATAYVGNPAFRTKLVLVLVALLNIAWFHARLTRGVRRSLVRLSAGLSLALWVGVLLAGRLIAYV